MLFTILVVVWSKKWKYCTDILNKHFNKALVMTKTGEKDFENSTNCCICDNVHVEVDVKVGDRCHNSGKYRTSAHRNCNSKMKLNSKIAIIFNNLNNFDSHLIMPKDRAN